MRDNIEDILQNIGAEAVPDDVQTIARETSNNFSRSLTQTGPSRQPILLETLMKSRISKLSAAAVILIGILVLTIFFVETNKGVVLAGVLERVEQVRAFMYKTTVAGNVITVTVSTEYGMKMEMDTTDPNTGESIIQQTFFRPDEKLVITIMPGQKKYTQMEYDDAFFARLRKENNDPREMIKQIMSSKYTELGRSVIGSKEVEGFQAADPTVFNGFAQETNTILWVDVETWLPVRTEIEYMSNDQVMASLVIDDYQWDIPVVASDFEPIIPEDFTSLTRDAIKMPSFDEEAALEGLKIIAEIFGQYPKNLNLMDLIQMFFDLRERGIKGNKGLMDAGLTLKEEMNQMKSEHIQKAMEIFGTFQSLGMFYMTLVEEQKEPIYYGESVGPEDADRVLMRWKISDNEYRIIFGDLSVGNVTAEELAALEEPKP